jgi:signal peptidase II
VFRPFVLRIAALVILLDQITKALAVAWLEGEAPIQLLGKYLGLSFTRNPGAAFSFATNATWLFTAFATIAAATIVWKSDRIANVWWALSLGGVLGGALGNLIDRLVRAPGGFQGHVVDFLMFPNFPLFNVADSAIVISAIGIAILSLRGIEYDTKLPKSVDS